MDGDRYIVTECMIIQDIDREEEEDVEHPAADRDTVRLEEQRGSGSIELGDVSGGGHEEELDKSQQRPCRRQIYAYSRRFTIILRLLSIPLSGSTLQRNY